MINKWDITGVRDTQYGVDFSYVGLLSVLPDF